MILKLIGGAMLLVLSFIFGECFLVNCRNRCLALEELYLFAEKAASGIADYRMTIGELAGSGSWKVLEDYGFFDSVLKDKPPAKELTDILTEEEAEKVARFASELGKTFADEQTVLCKDFAEEMRSYFANAKAELASKEKMYRLLPPLGAGSIIILMI